MEKIKKEEIEYLAKLAALSLTEKEIGSLKIDLEKIISYINRLQSIPTENVEPTSHILPLSNVFRKDSLGKSLEREKALSNAPYKKDGYFLVPRVIK